MPVAGARALLSAKAGVAAPSRQVLPRVAAASAFHIQHHGALLHRTVKRGFHTSPSSLARPEDGENNPPPAATEENPPKNDTTNDKNKPEQQPENNKPTETEPAPAPETSSAAAIAAAAKRAQLRTSGYGSARARANRIPRVEEIPQLEPDEFFLENNVSLYEDRPLGSLDTLLFPLLSEDQERILSETEAEINEQALSEKAAEYYKSRIVELAGDKEVLDRLVGRFQRVYNAAFLQVVALGHKPTDTPEKVLDVRELRELVTDQYERLVSWEEGRLQKEAGEYLETHGGETVKSLLFESPLSKKPEPEYSVCRELLAAVRSQLHTPPPPGMGGMKSEARRPVQLFTVLNRKGMAVPMEVVDDIATELAADVVHLSAMDLGRMLGKHMGQNLYLNRGSLSMLGYAAAEMNGRTVARADAEGEEGGMAGMVAVALPSRLRSYFSSRGESTAGMGLDGKWDDLKLTNALSALIEAADVKRGMRGGETEQRDLIVHIHDYVEIGALQSSLLNKIRTIVDRMWHNGRRAVIVASSASELKNSGGQWRDQIAEIGREGTHIIPFYSHEHQHEEGASENVLDNLMNIGEMVQAMMGADADVIFHRQLLRNEPLLYMNCTGTEKDKRLVNLLKQHVFDAQWVYRVATLLVGVRKPGLKRFSFDHLKHVLDFMSERDEHWKKIVPAVKPPYYSPLFTPRSPQMPNFFSGGPPDEFGQQSNGPSGTLPGGLLSKDLDQHEKKLASGLINAEDIHTTFDNIIVPQETKESLIGLTSLSLTRPEAFTYGVLKTERIPGCLLYGPPGTGKTLLAKAVAKESGANMLEVSAASINDMWLGQSEKNVRAIFSLARKLAPMVIFLDEADALLGARHNTPGRTAHRETITQFLREWDGMSDMRAFIMVATNRPFDLDEAVLRRLPRKILVDLPLGPEREKILGVMLKEEVLAEDVDLAQLAKETDLYSGSDLKNLCVSAAMEAVRQEVRDKEAWERERAAKLPEGEKAEGEVEEVSVFPEKRVREGGVEEVYEYPEKRVLTRKHFEKGLREISASISEDMDSLKAIRKFDEQYGDSGRRKKKKRGMGFEVVGDGKVVGTEEVRVRQVVTGV
ncbi:uncharacterized protein PODANS_6_5510 [Podospora anserina S mat+]|uniref:Podospora anserina S mat+ genomic DNA chromosome 6, supercontig 2 n=1 Tax=Podospora anserina (strain S / ATCC MYA-4624 / DSM 980 / FGSC 10383) TaxID=515849 RepID=B2B246_PODAN|nr:uncharacterized protein PODANS_6_5510 [Podospora anserina S mat+]CAP71181.1 unnamed protein product [Podospora anserina S mat+]CDP30581.1 Putative Protein MSP1 [Podospora anserina S mat+]